MLVILAVNTTQLAIIDGVLRDIEVGIGRTQDSAAPAALALAMETIGDRFFDEGPPDWKELALSTQRQRKVRGYGPAHPILRRSGDLLRSLTDPSDAQNIHRIRNYSKRTVGILGTKDPRYGILQKGNLLEGGHIPARWMWPGPGGPEEFKLMNRISVRLIGDLFDQVQGAKHNNMGVR